MHVIIYRKTHFVSAYGYGCTDSPSKPLYINHPSQLEDCNCNECLYMIIPNEGIYIMHHFERLYLSPQNIHLNQIFPTVTLRR